MTSYGLSPEAVAERRKGIGGSDAGRVMSGDWRSLWREKTGRAEPEDLSGNLAVQMGSATEAFNAFWFEKVTGRKVTRRNEHIVSARYPWMRANLDGVTTSTRGHRAYWDAKHVGRSDEPMILRYIPQMTHCAAILGVDWWVLSVFVGNSKHEIIEQEVDPFYVEELIAKEGEFWGYVERDEEPPEQAVPVLAPKPVPVLRKIQLEDAFKDTWPNWAGDMLPLIRTFSETYAAAAKHAIVRDEIKNLMPDDVGEVTRGLFRASRSKAGAVTIALKKGKDDGFVPNQT